MLVRPDGDYHPSRYDPSRRVAAQRQAPSQAPPSPERALPASPGSSGQPRPKIHPVVPARFRRGRLLGKGGQGSVYAGEYDGVVCAGKVGHTQSVLVSLNSYASLHKINCLQSDARLGT